MNPKRAEAAVDLIDAAVGLLVAVERQMSFDDSDLRATVGDIKHDALGLRRRLWEAWAPLDEGR